MRRFLLDTNAVSDLIRHPLGRVADQVRAHGVASVCTSIIVAAELRYGGLKSGSDRIRGRVEEAMSAIDVLPCAPPTDTIYARLRLDLERAGRPIGGNDLLIAAHTLALGHTLVTANTREFERIAELTIANWLADA